MRFACLGILWYNQLVSRSERVQRMHHRRFAPNVPLLFGMGVVCVAILLIVVFQEYGYDDPYITYRYAYNLLWGKGLVYNVGEPVLSTTAPGYALLLALSGLINGDLALWGNVLSAVGLAIGAISLYLWASEADPSAEVGRLVVGWVAGLLLLTFPLCVMSFGSEMCVYLGTTIAGLRAYARERPERAMAWLAVATLIRPDGALAAGLIVLHQILAYRRFPWKAAALYLAITLPWVVDATWTFGSPVPVTLGAKQAQGRMAISDSYVWGAVKMLADHARKPLYWLYLPLGAIGVWQIVKRKQTWWMLLAWTACSFLAYTILGVSRYFWYYVPLAPGVLASVAVGVGWIHKRLSAVRQPAVWRAGRWRWALTVVLVALLLVPNLRGLAYIYRHPDVRRTVYSRAGQWIDAHLPAEASVGALEVGIIGYYARRRIVDFAGLIQPEVQAQMSQGTTYQDTATWAVQHYRPGYLALNGDWFPEWKTGILVSCRPLQTFSEHGYEGSFTVYECNWEK